MSEIFDCIVLGVGGFGSGAFYHLAKRGVKVLGIEQFHRGHDRGSSHGETRIIRKAYFEHPNYVPLAVRAYDGWRELEAETGETLMRLAGVLLAGPPEGEAVGGAKTSAQEHNLTLEELTPEEARSRFPELRFPGDLAVVFEPDAGFLHVEQCVRSHIRQAEALGGRLKTGEKVIEWKSDGKTVEVRTNRDRYQAARLVITAGPWSAEVLEEYSLPLQVLRKSVFWHLLVPDSKKSASRLPVFLYELAEGVFYGLPGTSGTNLKLAEHSGGKPVSDPGQARRDVDPEDQKKVETFCGQYVPAVTSPFESHTVCFYTMTPDGHFVIDRHPAYQNVVLGAGFSGHGFKFTGILGQALTDLVLDGTTALPVDFLSLERDTLAQDS